MDDGMALGELGIELEAELPSFDGAAVRVARRDGDEEADADTRDCTREDDA